MSGDIPVVRVHVASAADGVMGGAPRRRRRSALYDTVTLTSDEPAQNILPESHARHVAFIVSLDQAIVIGPNKANVGSGVGTTVPQNVAWPIEDDNAVFAAPTPALTAGATARISVSATYEDELWR